MNIFSVQCVRFFFDVWHQSVFPGTAAFATIDQLSRWAIVQKEARPEYVQYVPIESLLDDMKQRFAYLFRVKPKWSFWKVGLNNLRFFNFYFVCGYLVADISIGRYNTVNCTVLNYVLYQRYFTLRIMYL